MGAVTTFSYWLNSPRRGGYLVLTSIQLLGTLICMSMAVKAVNQAGEEQDQLTFQAWSKHTGNPNSITFTEWRYLQRMHRPSYKHYTGQ